MRKKDLVSSLLALWLALLPVCVNFSFANEIDDKRAELSEVQQKMQEMETRRAAAREEAEAASASLDEVMGQLWELQAQSDQLERKSDALQSSIDENQAQLEAKQKELDERMQIYGRRLRNIYMNGQLNYLDILLGAADFTEFSSRMYLLQKIIARDVAMLEDIKKSTEEIKAHQEVLAKEMKEIQVTKAELDAKKAKVEEVRERRAQILYKAEEAKHDSEEEYDRLLAISENIAAMLRNMESGGGYEPAGRGGTGRFMWPCSGEITSYYGWRTHPVFGTTRYHSGMDIAVDYGTPIHAADSGTVIYSGWLGGYGNAVMIDHGGGLVTLYGHNQSLNVSEGEYVSKGTVIAYAGSTGWSTGPHCHFEVRLHGDVTEPLDYLP